MNLKGSEYLSDSLDSGEMQNGIRHEDMTRHSFANESLDYYLTFECFEHIPFYKKAINEAYRVLKPGGSFFGSFPFDVNQYQNFMKATINGKAYLQGKDKKYDDRCSECWGNETRRVFFSRMKLINSSAMIWWVKMLL